MRSKWFFSFFLFLCGLEADQLDWDLNRVRQYAHHSDMQRRWAMSFLAPHLRDLRGTERILDVGSGDGKITADISKFVPRGSVVGIDPSKSMLDWAKKQYSSVEYSNLFFQKGSFLHPNLLESFDLIVSISALQHCLDQYTAFKHLEKLLKPDGKLVLSIPSMDNAVWKQACKNIESSPKWRACWQGMNPKRVLTVEEYREVLELVGLFAERVEKITTVDPFVDRVELLEFLLGSYYSSIGEERVEEFYQELITEYIRLQPDALLANGVLEMRFGRIEIEAKKKECKQMIASPRSGESLEAVISGWNCDLFARMYFHYSEMQRQWAWELLGKAPFKGDEIVLDFGCGDGKISAEISHLVPRGSVVGVDPSLKMLQLAKRKFPSFAYPNLDFRATVPPTFSDEYDVICSFTVFHLVNNPVEVLVDLRSHLKMGGKLLLVIPTGNNKIFFQAADELFLKYGFTHSPHANRSASSKAMRTVEGCSSFLKEAGYKIESIELIETKNAFYEVEEFVLWMVGTVAANWNIPADISYRFFTDLVNRMRELDPGMVDDEGRVLYDNARIHAIAS